MLNTTIIQCERAIEDIRRGAVVKLEHQDDVLYLLAAEEVSVEYLGLFSNPRLLISGQRIAFLTDDAVAEAQSVAVDNMDHVLKYAGAVSPLDKEVFTDTQPVSAIEALALEFMKLTHILPAVVVSKQIVDDNIRPLVLTQAMIEQYRDALDVTLSPVLEAPLVLEDANQARIVAFRPAVGGNEHYAIIIGEPEKSQAPLVRVHSSCYTGDLLGSLGCDCGQQLRGAIAQMGASDEGGVIVYLLQEGRGIGLTNKLRTYAIQAEGIDTVDANHYLGFEDDARLFSLAAKMLQQLDMTTIKLLSNNPRKAKGLEPYGINVAEYVPHVMEANEHNKHYLETKISKLGHRKNS